MDDTELAAQLSPESERPGPHPTVVIDAGPVDGVLEHLLLHFDRYPMSKLRVQRGDVLLGYLDAGTLYRIVPELTRGIGDSDHFGLPGEADDEVITFECPVAGCGYELSVVLYPAGSVLGCPRHPGGSLRARA